MAEKLIIETIEAHAEGEGGRVITNMAHLVKGETMKERFDYCEANLDWFRHAILHEPRGYPALCAVFILPPVSKGSDFGIIVLEQGGFTAMSGKVQKLRSLTSVFSPALSIKLSFCKTKRA